MEAISDLGYLLSKAAKAAKWNLGSRLLELGLTPAQMAVLMDVARQEAMGSEEDINLTLASISGRLNSDRPTISGIVLRLEKDDWIFRKINKEDRRSYIIRLTHKAKAHIGILDEISNKTMSQAIEGFSLEEIQCLKGYLIRVIDNFDMT